MNYANIDRSLAFPPYAYYNTCNMQKRQIMLNRHKILCKQAP